MILLFFWGGGGFWSCVEQQLLKAARSAKSFMASEAVMLSHSSSDLAGRPYRLREGWIVIPEAMRSQILLEWKESEWIWTWSYYMLWKLFSKVEQCCRVGLALDPRARVTVLKLGSGGEGNYNYAIISTNEVLFLLCFICLFGSWQDYKKKKPHQILFPGNLVERCSRGQRSTYSSLEWLQLTGLLEEFHLPVY